MWILTHAFFAETLQPMNAALTFHIGLNDSARAIRGKLQVHGKVFGESGQSVYEVSKSNLPAQCYRPYTIMCTVTLTLGKWPNWLKAITDHWAWTTIVWCIIQIQLIRVKSNSPVKTFCLHVHYDNELRDMTSGQGHDTPLDHGQQKTKNQSNQTCQWKVMALTHICGYEWPWPWSYHL